jgi:hypothetical protein
MLCDVLTVDLPWAAAAALYVAAGAGREGLKSGGYVIEGVGGEPPNIWRWQRERKKERKGV